MSNTINAQDLAARLLADKDLCALAGRFGSEKISHSERETLVQLGLAEPKADHIAPGGRIWVLTPMGRVASRLARMAELVAEKMATN
jgi:hypothetical protein